MQGGFVLTWTAIQPVVDLGRTTDDRVAPGPGLLRHAGRIGRIGSRRHRLPGGLKLHYPQPGLQRLLPGEGLALFSLQSQPLHLIAMSVGLVAGLVGGIGPGLARQGMRRDLGCDGGRAGQGGDSDEDEGLGHDFKMGAKPVRAKRGHWSLRAPDPDAEHKAGD